MALILDKNKLNDIFNMPNQEQMNLQQILDDIDDQPIDVDSFAANSAETLQKESEEKPKLKVSLDNVDSIYQQFGEMIESGNQVLSSVKMILEENPDGEMLSGASALMNSIKDMMKEFTKLYNMKMRFEQQKELEMMKARIKQEQILLKSQETQKLLLQKLNPNQNPGISGQEAPLDMVSFCQEEVVKAMAKAKNTIALNAPPTEPPTETK